MRFVTVIHLLVFSLAALADEPVHVKLGVNPNIWFPQPAVIEGNKWDTEHGLDVDSIIFPGPSHNLQAFIAGTIDVMNNNAASVLLAADRGLRLRVVAVTTAGDISLVARGDLANRSDLPVLERLKNFRARSGRKAILVTNPKGSLSEITMRRWFQVTWPGYERELEIIHAGDQTQLQQIFLSGEADLCSAFGSLEELFKLHDVSVREIVSPPEISRVQPGGLAVVTEEYYQSNTTTVLKLRDLYQRASKKIGDDPASAIPHLDRYLTGRVLPKAVLLKSITSRLAYISGHDDEVPEWLNDLSEFMFEHGYLSRRGVQDKVLPAVNAEGQ